jgi:hypothetical protein
VGSLTNSQLWGRFWTAIFVQYFLLIVLLLIFAAGVQDAKSEGFNLALVVGGPGFIAAAYFAWKYSGELANSPPPAGYAGSAFATATLVATFTVAFLPLPLIGWLAIADGDAETGLPFIGVFMALLTYRLIRHSFQARNRASDI